MSRRPAFTFLSVCSGIEAASVAWEPLGMKPVGFSEIAPFPAAVLKHHFPKIPNYGNLTRYQTWPALSPSLLVGGTPCPSFSIAGKKTGLEDPRGKLAFAFVGVAAKYRPRWILWENVPHVLATNAGRDFSAIVGHLTGRCVEPPPAGWGNAGIITGTRSAYGLAWRVLDAQFTGVAQQRRRLFLVGFLGDWRRAAAALFEPESLRGDSPPRRDTKPDPSAAQEGFGISGEPVARTLNAGGQGRQDFDTETLIATTITGKQDHAQTTRIPCLTGTPYADRAGDESRLIVPDTAACLRARDMAKGVDSDCTDTLIAFTRSRGDDGRGHDRPPQLHHDQSPTVEALHPPSVLSGSYVRRLTPEECERLQGFPTGWTDIPISPVTGPRESYRIRQHNGAWWKFAADHSRYRAIGNSMAVTMMRELGKRILEIDKI